MATLGQKRSFAVIAIHLLMDQTAIQPDFMPHTNAGPQSGPRMSDGNLIMGSVKPHPAENLMAMCQKPSFINGHG